MDREKIRRLLAEIERELAIDESQAQTFDFGDENGPVPAHRHVNPDSSQGGWVADTARVEPTCYIGPDARVYGSAWVFGNARVSEYAQVSGSARVHDGAHVCGHDHVSGNVWVSKYARASGDAETPRPLARVFGNAWVSTE